MDPSWFTSVLGFLLCMSAFSTAVPADLSKREFTYVPGISREQQSILSKAFSDAIFIAQNALHIPSSISEEQQEVIYDRYFPPEARDTVTSIYSNIIGGNPQTGSTALTGLLVDVTDPEQICPKTLNYMARNGSVIIVCPAFWTKIGEIAERTCADLPDDIVSWQMTFPGDSIFHMLIGFIGTGAVEGRNIVNYGIKDKKGYSGAATAIWIRHFEPDVAIYSAMSYDWYALELYWTAKCGRNFRTPLNEMENLHGVCHGDHCGTIYQR